jgi:hypothetical protein
VRPLSEMKSVKPILEDCSESALIDRMVQKGSKQSIVRVNNRRSSKRSRLKSEIKKTWDASSTCAKPAMSPELAPLTWLHCCF